jgi:hypothetical protein
MNRSKLPANFKIDGSFKVSEPIPQSLTYCAFLYFLIDNEEVVYIGSTSDLSTRIWSHKKDKKFNEVKYIMGTDRVFILYEEERYIKMFSPKYNIEHCKHRKPCNYTRKKNKG